MPVLRPLQTDGWPQRWPGPMSSRGRFLFNAMKASEYGRQGGVESAAGQSEDPPSTDVSASTITETNISDKTGDPLPTRSESE